MNAFCQVEFSCADVVLGLGVCGWGAVLTIQVEAVYEIDKVEISCADVDVFLFSRVRMKGQLRFLDPCPLASFFCLCSLYLLSGLCLSVHFHFVGSFHLVVMPLL